MKIVLISTSEKIGGAAIAAYRLMQALNKQQNINAFMIVRDGNESIEIKTTTHSKFKKIMNFIRFAWERLIFLFYERSKNVRFLFSLANTGEDISLNPLIQKADIIHMHWINGGFLSIKSIQKIIKLGKPIVWTLHDMWLFTGGCHYSLNCSNYVQKCGNCLYLKYPYDKDLSYVLWNKKYSLLLSAKNLHIVTCSNWLKQLAQKSSLLKHISINNIPNTLNTEVFKPLYKKELRRKYHFNENKKYILFAAANVNNYYKGFNYYIEALNIFKSKYYTESANTEVILVGIVKDTSVFSKIPLPYHFLGQLNAQEIIEVYNIVDLYVLSSIQDNLPNTIMESLACGTPVVAFNTGGIPEMIEHKKNGWVAEYKSCESLAEGIHWVLFEADWYQLSNNAREKVVNSYNENLVAQQYIEVYKKISIK